MALIATRSRIDLEEDILEVWAMKKDIENFLTLYCDLPERLDDDQVFNYLNGIANVFELRMEKLWDTFMQVHQLDQYNPNHNDELNEFMDALKPKKKGKK